MADTPAVLLAPAPDTTPTVEGLRDRPEAGRPAAVPPPRPPEVAMPRNPTPDISVIIGDHLEFREDTAAPRSQLVEVLARTLRGMRDRQQAATAADQPGAGDAG